MLCASDVREGNMDFETPFEDYFRNDLQKSTHTLKSQLLLKKA